MTSKRPSRDPWRSFPRFALLLGLCSTVSAQPVVLFLKNGDRITGTVLLEDTNRVVLSNVWIKTVSVPVAEISRRENRAAPANGGPVPPVGLGAVAVGKSISELAGTNAVAALPTRRFAGEVLAGTDLGFGTKDRQLYTGRLKVTYGSGHFRSVFDYLFTYGKSDGLLSANRMDASSKSDFDLSRRVYVYNLAAGGYDEIRKIDARYEAGPGVGYKLIVGKNFLLKAEYGLNYQAQYLANDTSRESVYHRLAEEFVWKISTKFSLTERFEYFPRLTEINQYRMRFEANLRYAMWNNVSFNLTVIDVYDNQLSVGVQPNDLQLLSSIGLKF